MLQVPYELLLADDVGSTMASVGAKTANHQFRDHEA